MQAPPLSPGKGGRILGVDPGRTCGLALLSQLDRSILWSGESFSIPEIHRVIKERKPTVVAIEDFVGSGPRTTHGIATMKLIGVVFGICEVYGIPIVEQPPQFRRPKLTMSQQMLPKASRHIHDALAHCLAYYYAHPGEGLE